MDNIYLITFLICIPVIWNILIALRFENNFKQGRIWQIKLGYIFLTLICSHLLAQMMDTFAKSIYSLF